jgi:putative ABC transport system substrate-binding protein
MRHSSRRQFLQGSLVLGGVALLAGCGIPSGPPARPSQLHRIGFLSQGTPQPAHEGLRQRLRELGHVEGQNLTIEYRFAEGRSDRLPELAAELVRLGVDIIVAVANPAIQAAKQATGTIPIIMAPTSDPVGQGLVTSLARPGGNVTGFSNLAPELSGKRVELLKEAFPRVARVGVLWNVGNSANALAFRDTEAAAGVLKVEMVSLEVRGTEDFDGAFNMATHSGADALITLQDPLLNTQRTQIADFAATHRLPAMYHMREYVEVGGLMAYGASLIEMYRRAASYVDQIFKGAKPADLPVEQPTGFEFVVNLEAARALGLTIPPSVLQQATEILQ